MRQCRLSFTPAKPEQLPAHPSGATGPWTDKIFALRAHLHRATTLRASLRGGHPHAQLAFLLDGPEAPAHAFARMALRIRMPRGGVSVARSPKLRRALPDRRATSGQMLRGASLLERRSGSALVSARFEPDDGSNPQVACLARPPDSRSRPPSERVTSLLMRRDLPSVPQPAADHDCAAGRSTTRNRTAADSSGLSASRSWFPPSGSAAEPTGALFAGALASVVVLTGSPSLSACLAPGGAKTCPHCRSPAAEG
jgi:hypothetical protein